MDEDDGRGTLGGGRRGVKRGWEDDDEDFDQDRIRAKRMRDDGESDAVGWRALREALEDNCVSRERYQEGDGNDKAGETRSRKRKRYGSDEDAGGGTSFEIVLR